MPTFVNLNAPSLADFERTVDNARKQHHTELKVDKQGVIHSSNPSWSTRAVRFLKSLVTGKPPPLSHAQKRSIDAFRDAIEEKYHQGGTRLLNDRLKHFAQKKVAVNIKFYAQVIKDLKA